MLNVIFLFLNQISSGGILNYSWLIITSGQAAAAVAFTCDACTSQVEFDMHPSFLTRNNII